MPEVIDTPKVKVNPNLPTPPIERLRGKRPSGWGMSDQIAEDFKTKKDEWDNREAKKNPMNPKPFPGLGKNYMTNII